MEENENDTKKEETKEKRERRVAIEETLSYAPQEPEEFPPFKKVLAKPPQEPKDISPVGKKTTKSSNESESQKNKRKRK